MFRLYGKDPRMRRFQAIDLASGNFVANLIYASFWETKSEVEAVKTHLEIMNTEMTFQVRKV